METPASDAKYQKLASEYSKIRAQANVLRKALLEEQQKTVGIRETLRLRDTALRRAEQEVDSLGFRNKQLEQRVASLQDDLQTKTPSKSNKSSKVLAKVESTNGPTVSLLEEELQKKIIENAELSSLVADHNGERTLLYQRIGELEQSISRNFAEHSEKEKQLRTDLSALTAKYSGLELRISENGGSTLGSDDALSISDHDTSFGMHELPANSSSHQQTPKHPTALCHQKTRNADEIRNLQQEVFRLKAQLEFHAIRNLSDKALEDKAKELHRASAGPVGAPWTVSKRELAAKNTKSNLAELGEEFEAVTRDYLFFQHFSERLDTMFTETALANSKAANYMTECESLQSNLEIVQDELKQLERRLAGTQNQLQISDEDLATTRINYEEQISVLTEQVISLSEQLASASS